MNISANRDFNPLDNIDENFVYQNGELNGRYILNPDNKRVGKVVAHLDNLGIGLFNIGHLEDQVHYIQDDVHSDLNTMIWTPNWMRGLIPTLTDEEREAGKELSINPKAQYSLYRSRKDQKY